MSAVQTIDATTNVVALTPLEMLNTAISRGADMGVLERLMALHERWEANNARKAFDAAISQAKAEIKPITHNAKGHNDRTYADFSAIASAVDPILAKHGLSYRFRTDQTDRILVTCILSHKDGHSETTTLAGPPDNSGSKNAIQAIGSTLTYLQRYSLTQMLGLASAKDDDAKGPEVSEEQVEEIRRAIVEVGADIERFCRYFKIVTVDDLPAARFNDAMRMLSAKGGK